jgi:hypothetical protein
LKTTPILQNKNNLKLNVMKKQLFFLTMLVNVTASAQSTVQITPISATYTSTPTIQFKVSWTSQTATNHRNKVWVFVDFQPVISPTQKGNWQPATITGTVQKTAGTISEQSNRGFFLEGTTTNFSSIVTVQLSNVSTAQFNWCAYATDYPPNAVSYSGGSYTFKGTKPFIVNGTSVNDNKYAVTKITSLTDATGCPGGVGRDEVHNDGICAPGLTAVGSYCRDLAADGASTNTSCGIEVKMDNSTLGAGCPNGWQIATIAQLECMRPNEAAFNLAGSYVDPTPVNAGHWLNVSYCASCSAMRRWYSNSRNYVHPDLCSEGCNHQCVGNMIRWYGECSNSELDVVKCIR